MKYAINPFKTLFHNLINAFTFYVDDPAGGGDPAAVAAKAAEAQAKLIADAVKAGIEKETAGLLAKNTELLGKMHMQSDALKQWEGIDPVTTREMLKRFEQDEEGQLIAKGKLDEVVGRRTEKLRLAVTKEAEDKVKEAMSKVEAANLRAKKFDQRVLDNQIRAAAAKAGIHSHAIDDALARGHMLFVLNDDGDAVQLGGDGKPVLGKDGRTPYSPEEWLESMKVNAPHWFPVQNSGGGAGGSGVNAGAGGKTMTRSEHDARVNRGESVRAFIMGGGKIIDG